MDILCSTDKNYIMPTGVMLTSLLENNNGKQVRIHVLTDAYVDDAQKESLRQIVRHHRATIDFYTMEDSLFADFPMGEAYQSQHINTLATYYRLYAHKVLPGNVEKVLYLDGDIIVRHSLDDIWNTDMTNCPIAAVPDSENCSVGHYNRLRYPVEMGYFNAGVLLINLEYWRKNDVLDDFLCIIKDKRPVLRCHDQDVLNYLFRENKKMLPLKYNMQNSFLYRRELVPLPWTLDDQIAEGQKQPVIIHFVTTPKPWHSDCHHPYKAEFEYYRNKTEWKDIREKRFYQGRRRLYWTVVKLAIKLGLSKPMNDPDTFYVDRVRL